MPPKSELSAVRGESHRHCNRNGTIASTLKRALLTLVALLLLPYARSAVYRFPPPTTFAGNQFYNPYADLKPDWQRANFHAHGRAWSGMTSGAQTNEDVVKEYHALGYAVAGISNYQHISRPEPTSIPIYEHGYNLGKRHQLAIGARRVEWFDFPFLQSTHHQQLVLDLVGKTAELVAIAHPSIRTAYSAADLKQLTGYQLLEVVNGPFADDWPWDMALSSGHPVWGLANDDSHDVTEVRRRAMAWNMVNASTTSEADIIAALRGGHFYAVMRLDEKPAADLTSIAAIEFKDGTLTLRCTGALPDAFEFFGQDGIIKKTVRDSLTASYTFRESDSYVRALIWTPRHAFYLNPILRWDGARLPAPAARIDQLATWLLRLSLVAVGALAAVAILRKKQK